MRLVFRHRTAALCALIALLLFSGCRRVDSTADVAAAAQLVTDRSDIAPDWQAKAPTWDGETPLTRELAIRLALANQPTLQSQRATIAAARADLEQAGLLPNPMLSLFLGLEDGDVSMLNAGVMQPLSALWLRKPRMRQANSQLQQAILLAADAALMSIDQVDQSLAQVRFHERSCANHDEQRVLLQRAQAAARDKLQLGMGTAFDVSRVTADLLMLESELLMAQSMLLQEKQQLLKLLGLPEENTTFSIASDVDPAPPQQDENVVIARARQQRLDLLAAQWSVKSARDALVAAKRSRWPQIDAGAEIERESPGDEPAMTVAGPALNVTIPIFDTGSAKVAKESAMLEKALADARALEHTVIREVRSAHAQLTVAEDQLRLYREKILPQAQKNAADAQAGFDTGQLDLTDVLMARRQLAMSQQKHLEFIRDAAIARSQLRRSTGGR
jgi:cobalt-zinc-cadmium efflux system outer membrane protein